MTLRETLRVDGKRLYASLTDIQGVTSADGPYWMTLGYGDLIGAQSIFVTNGAVVYPISSILHLTLKNNP